MRPKVVCHYLLEKMRLAGVSKAYIILRKRKWDIPAYLGDGSMLDMHLGYLILNLPFGVPYTLDQAYPFVQDAMVIFGFPDIIFQPDDAFVKLLTKQEASKADLVLGLFPAHQSHKMDMVEIGADGHILKIEIKPVRTHLSYTWIIAVWTPIFTHFMHKYLVSGQGTKVKYDANDGTEIQKEIFLGDIIQAAIQNDLRIDKVFFEDGRYLDIGTPEDMVKAVQLTKNNKEY